MGSAKFELGLIGAVLAAIAVAVLYAVFSSPVVAHSRADQTGMLGAVAAQVGQEQCAIDHPGDPERCVK